MIRDIDLKKYLPPFLQKYRELRMITLVENPEFQFVADESERIKDNQFIVSADSEGLKRFERLLKIQVKPGETLEMRRSRVLSRWNEVAVYTLQGLIQKLNSMHNGRSYYIELVNDEYLLKLITNLTERGQIDELEMMLSYFVPMNIEANVKNEFVIEEVADVSHSGVMTNLQIYEF